MQYIERHELPDDHYYHRTASPVYKAYLEKCWPTAIELPWTPQFWWVKNLIGKNLQIAKYERIDVEPDLEYIHKQHPLGHGILIWVPWRRTDIPPHWKKLYLSSHFKENGFTTLDENFQKKWNERARRAHKKFLKSKAEIRLVDENTFIDAFKKTRVRHLFKSDYIKFYKDMMAIDPSSIRSWVCYYNWKPVAWLAVHDYCENSSVHLVAFTGKEAYPIQGWTGLIHEWFQDSLEKGMKYINFDQLRQKYGPADQKGYSMFKENFIEYRVSYPTSYFQFF